ncbi:serine/threonine protein kinase [Candidatus Woesearchaeota archaeon]|nr:serine/threonine protein kinase [Candidatus Woesearchaeota archaeon]
MVIGEDFWIGKKISDYEITGFLGNGGMGIVYKAQDRERGKTAAVKTFPLEFEFSTNDIKRIKRELQITSALNKKSRHIVDIEFFGAFVEQGNLFPFYVMEYIPHSLPRKAKTLDEAVNIVYGAACGLKTTHDTREIEFDRSLKIFPDSPDMIHKNFNFIYDMPPWDIVNLLDNVDILYNEEKKIIKVPEGIIHRDIKPGNIRIASDRTTKIIDFGISELKKADVTNITGGGLVGTPLYMSPEQINGEEINTKTDVFSLGLVFYKLLTGVLPWRLEERNSYVDIIVFYNTNLLKNNKEALKQARPSSAEQKYDYMEIPEPIDDLVYSMLQPDGINRLEIRQVVNALEVYQKKPKKTEVLSFDDDETETYIHVLQSTSDEELPCETESIGCLESAIY